IFPRRPPLYPRCTVCSLFAASSLLSLLLSSFFFNDPAPTEIYTLSLHDALPICLRQVGRAQFVQRAPPLPGWNLPGQFALDELRSEEHTSELQSLTNLVCRLLLEKKKTLQSPTDYQAHDADALDTNPSPTQPSLS